MDMSLISGTIDLDAIEATINQFGVPIFLIDVEDESIFRYRVINNAHMHSTGMNIKAVAGKTPEEIFPARLAESFCANYRQCIEKREVFSYEEVLTMPTTETWWQTSLTPVFGNERVTGLVGVSFDITRFKKTEKFLSENLEEASAANNDLRILSNTIAHDLRAPLRQLGMIKSLVMKDFKDLGDNKFALLTKAREIIDKALAKLDELMRQTNEEDTRSNIVTTIDFEKWFLDIIAILDPLKKYDFEYPSLLLSCEKIVLDIALRNLMDNACKHANSKISIEIASDDDDLVFTVRDDGPGFSPDHFKAGMSPKANLTDASALDRVTGFGLTASRRLIEMRGGKLWIEETSESSNGGIVSFRIPGKIKVEDFAPVVMHGT